MGFAAERDAGCSERPNENGRRCNIPPTPLAHLGIPALSNPLRPQNASDPTFVSLAAHLRPRPSPIFSPFSLLLSIRPHHTAIPPTRLSPLILSSIPKPQSTSTEPHPNCLNLRIHLAQRQRLHPMTPASHSFTFALLSDAGERGRSRCNERGVLEGEPPPPPISSKKQNSCLPRVPQV